MGTVTSFVVGVLSSLGATLVVYAVGRSRFRLTFPAILRLINEVSDAVRSDNYYFDQMLTIGRSSGVVGSILAGQFGLQAVVSLTVEKRTSSDGGRVMIIDELNKEVMSLTSDKKLLVVLCCNDSGATLKFVVDELAKMDRPPSSIRTASIYTAPSPVYKPTYSAVVVGHHTRKSMTQILNGLPWVQKGWRQPFARERTGG